MIRRHFIDIPVLYPRLCKFINVQERIYGAAKSRSQIGINGFGAQPGLYLSFTTYMLPISYHIWSSTL